MKTLLQAIAQMEGFYKPGTRPNRNNNPGDLEFHGWETAYGGKLESGSHPRFAVFPDAQSGFNAMRALLQTSLYKGLTIEQALNKWAPPVENNVSAYLAGVLEMTGLTADTVIDSHLG